MLDLPGLQVPPSEERIWGTPLSANRSRRQAMRPLATEPADPGAARVMSNARLKKSAAMLSKGVVGGSDCSPGTCWWEGAMVLHAWQPASFFSTSTVYPGQNSLSRAV